MSWIISVMIAIAIVAIIIVFIIVAETDRPQWLADLISWTFILAAIALFIAVIAVSIHEYLF